MQALRSQNEELAREKRALEQDAAMLEDALVQLKDTDEERSGEVESLLELRRL